MTSHPSSWSAHIKNLPEPIQNHGHQLRHRMRQAMERLGKDPLASYIFLPEQSDHVEHEDAALVFDAAISQWVVRYALSPHEVPLLYLGHHTAIRMTGVRFAQGFVLTDQALYAQDDCSVIGEMPAPKVYALPQQHADAASFLAYATGRFAWEDWAQLCRLEPSSLREQALFVLQHGLQAVLDYHQQHGTQLRLQAMPIALSPFIAHHGLQNELLLGDDPAAAKKLAKVVRKFCIPAQERLHLAWVDFIWFGPPWGLAMTDQALYTRDLLEQPIRIPLEKVDPASLHYSDDGKEMRLNGKIPLFLPAHFKTSIRDEMRALLQQEIQSLITAKTSPRGYAWRLRRQA
jgi:hypothetical protein